MVDAGVHTDRDLIGELGLSLRDYAIYTLDPAGVVTSWNAGAEEILGAPAADVIGGLADVYTAEQVEAGHAQWILDRAREQGTHIDEGWRVRRDGNRFWAHVVTTALWSSTGELRGYAKVMRDDTEMHSRLESSRQLFRDLYGLTPVAICLFDRFGYVLDCNDAMCELLGHSAADMRGRHITTMICADDPGFEMLAEAFRSGNPPDEPKVQEWSLTRADGRRVYCEVHIASSEQPNGEPFWLAVYEDVTHRHQEAEALRYWARHDELTGLWNRAAVPELLADAHPERAAVLYCDIRNFNRINESLGYAAGDDVLIAMARRLEANLPEGWSVARAAADEFAVICPDVDAAGGLPAVATTVSGLMRATLPVRGQVVQVAALIGVAVAGDSGGRGEDLLRVASASALKAKKYGHTSIAVAGPTLIGSLDGQLRMETELRRALDEDRLVLHYQPSVSADGTIVSAEALVRWPHPERGLLTPVDFLPIAAQSGMLADLDAWALRTALREAASWPTPPTGQPVSVSVNLAELMPGFTVFTDLIERAVADSGIDWNRIVLELVETAIVDLPSRMRAAMSALRDRGVRFAVDDFGTGYSSLTRIRQFPAQIIKIDRTFIDEIAGSTYDYVLVRTVTELARALGCSTVAEGVETVEQFDVLRSIPVDAYQGWLFSRAVPGGELAELIRSGPLKTFK
ncbi:putative bifunctional diguanylate cyclase/phosphodiesterase [Saccharopolyspora taberi]|uniref:EAL domain-containing protein n=1 Tax=Saccharopolyspora taberi TaxID=60895 RepID=A0ABN3VNW7_9PSEU